MAGRGTDILLGGNPDYMARLKLGELLFPEVVSQVRGVISLQGSGRAPSSGSRRQTQTP